MRNNVWLAERLQYVHHEYFIDVDIPNVLFARFGRSSRTRLGSISSKQDVGGTLTSIITLTGYFKELSIPEYVLDATLAHELAHYTHGFHSPHPRAYTHPHRGNIIGKELAKRGAIHLVEQQQIWLHAYWRLHLARKQKIR